MSALTNGTIIVNDATIAIKPDSIKYKRGVGDRKMRTQSVGDSVEHITTEDLTTKIGMISFTLIGTDANAEAVANWQDNFDTNAVEMITTSGYTLVLQQAVMTVDPEIAVAVEGEIEVVFNGNELA